MMLNLMSLLRMMQGGGNPMQLAGVFAQQNPQAQPAMQLIQGKNPQQLRETFFNLCKSKGVNPQDVARQCGVQLPND